MSTQSTLVADRYRLVEMLRTGAMAIVWQAWDERLHRPVVLTILPVEAQIGGAERQPETDRALRAGRVAAELRHPHAESVLDVVEHNGRPCIVTHPRESIPLSLLLSERGTLPPSEAARIAAQVASALAAAHRMGIVHGGVDPDSVALTPDGSAVIGDFGMVQAMGEAVTAPGRPLDSAYIAPEVAKGRAPLPASDVFSLGAMLYEMVEGFTPFGRQDAAGRPHASSGAYPPPEHAGSLAPLLRRMLSVHPKRRPSMASVANSLSAVADDVDDAFALLGIITGTAPIDDAGRSADDLPREPVGLRPAALAAVSVADAASEERDPDAPTPVAADAVTEELEPEEPAPAAVAMTHAVTEQLEPDAAEPAAVPIADAVTEVLQPDRPARPEPETRLVPGVAAVPAAVGTASVAARVWKGAPPAGPSRRRRRGAGVIAGILILLVALPVGAALLVNPLSRDVDAVVSPTHRPTFTAAPAPPPTAADPGPSTAAPPDPAASAAPSAPGTAPRTPSPVVPPRGGPSEAAAPAPSEPAPPADEPAPPPAPSEQQVVDMISGYYALVPGNRDAAWGSMTADYQQNHAGGRGGYEAFWSAIESVEVADVVASGPDAAQATLTYHFFDGRVVRELTSFRLVDEGGVLKIAESAVLSSVQP